MSRIRYRINSLPLFVKLLVLMLIVSLVPLAIAMGTMSQTSVSRAEREMQDLSVKQASTVQMFIREEGETVLQTAHTFGWDSSLTAAVAKKDRSAIRDRVMMMIRVTTYLAHVEDDQGRNLFRSYDPGPDGSNEGSLPLVKASLAGGTPPADLVFDKSLGLSVRGSVPLIEDGRLVGVLTIGQPIAGRYANHVRELFHSSADVSFYWGDQLTATTLKRKGSADPVSGITAPPAIADRVLTGGTPYAAITPFEGRNYLMRYEPIVTGGKPQGMIAVALDRRSVEEESDLILRTALLTGGILLLVVAAASILSARAISRPLRSIMRVLRQVAMGDHSARAPVTSEDELGVLAASLNNMLNATTALIQTKEERDTIQREIERLLDEVSTVADGDLTVQAEVTAGLLGAVADSFNYMIDELRKIIANVHTTTVEVTSSASQILASSQTLANGSEAQAQEISQTSAAMRQTAQMLQQVAENARLSSEVAMEALANARQGSQAVEKTISAMGAIRDNAQETSKKIKRLGESSQEIGEIVQLIEDIADQTNLLALNAAIQAAMAGEHGRGFAVVADEVRRLAERSTSSAKQIATLVKSIQSDTHEAVVSMEESTRQVVAGSHLADDAGRSLQSIEAVVDRVAKLIQDITDASTQQATVSEGIAKAMNELSEITKQASISNKQNAASVNYLDGLAARLRDSVSTFRLPPAHT
ncbi:MAG: HAMP domain-containing protein [Chloroflexi bacterium]|nr:HAMP domain-containing protein [Chloroflexota bacterium]